MTLYLNTLLILIKVKLCFQNLLKIIIAIFLKSCIIF